MSLSFFRYRTMPLSAAPFLTRRPTQSWYDQPSGRPRSVTFERGINVDRPTGTSVRLLWLIIFISIAKRKARSLSIDPPSCPTHRIQRLVHQSIARLQRQRVGSKRYVFIFWRDGCSLCLFGGSTSCFRTLRAEWISGKVKTRYKSHKEAHEKATAARR